MLPWFDAAINDWHDGQSNARTEALPAAPADDRKESESKPRSDSDLSVLMGTAVVVAGGHSLALCRSGWRRHGCLGAWGRSSRRVGWATSIGFDVLAHARRFVQLSPEIEERASVFHDAGLKPLDALHFACEIEVGADYFCTCDDRLLKRAQVVHSGPPKVVSPLELIAEIGP